MRYNRVNKQTPHSHLRWLNWYIIIILDVWHLLYQAVNLTHWFSQLWFELKHQLTDLLAVDSPWSQMALGCRSSPPPRSWSDLPGMRFHPGWSCQSWSPCCRTLCCTCSWVSSPWCAALRREAWETSGANLLSLVSEINKMLSKSEEI